VDTGRVVMAINNAPTNDAWLRVDGTNMMLANLNMGDGSHDLVNARNIEANGLGIFGEGIAADGDILTTKNLFVGNNTPGDDVGIIFADDMLVGEVTINGVNPLVSNAIYDMRMVPSGTVVPKPKCNGGVADIVATPASFANDVLAKAIHSIQTKISDQGAGWLVEIEVLTSDGATTLTNNLGILSVFTKCNG